MLYKPTNCLTKLILMLLYMIRIKSAARGIEACFGAVASLVLVAYLSVEEISLTANGVKFLTVLSATLSSSDSSLQLVSLTR